MWQINEVVLFDNDPYRILAIEDGQVVWMQISADKGVPQARAELLLMQYLDEGRLVRTDDPYVHLDLEEPSVDSVSFQKREEDYRKILPIINSKDRFDPKAVANSLSMWSKNIRLLRLQFISCYAVTGSVVKRLMH